MFGSVRENTLFYRVKWFAERKWINPKQSGTMGRAMEYVEIKKIVLYMWIPLVLVRDS